MSEYKAVMKNKLHAVLCAYFPAWTVSGPYPETLRKWDELLRTRPVAALGGSDAHSRTYRLGPIERVVHPYAYLYRSVNTHLLTEEPPSGDVARDKAAIYGALRAGRGLVGYEQPGSIAGFCFWARSGEAEATMGESLAVHGSLELHVSCPRPARVRLLRDGQVVAQARGERLDLVTHQAGVYRVEVTRRYAGRWRGWIFSNPIYVT